MYLHSLHAHTHPIPTVVQRQNETHIHNSASERQGQRHKRAERRKLPAKAGARASTARDSAALRSSGGFSAAFRARKIRIRSPLGTILAFGVFAGISGHRIRRPDDSRKCERVRARAERVAAVAVVDFDVCAREIFANYHGPRVFIVDPVVLWICVLYVCDRFGFAVFRTEEKRR